MPKLSARVNKMLIGAPILQHEPGTDLNCIGNGIRGYGDTKWMFLTQALWTVGVVGLAFLCVFVFKLGMLGVFIAVLCDEAIRAVINFIRFLKIKF